MSSRIRRKLCENMECGIICRRDISRVARLCAAQSFAREHAARPSILFRCHTELGHRYPLAASIAELKCCRRFSSWTAASATSLEESSSTHDEQNTKKEPRRAKRKVRAVTSSFEKEVSIEQQQTKVSVTDEGVATLSVNSEAANSDAANSEAANSEAANSANIEAAIGEAAKNEVAISEAAANNEAANIEAANSEAVQNNVTIIAFDIETTGFRASEDRIIEFAARDLAGGERSTVSALVNPGRKVPYYISAITGITNAMVNKPHVPSWKEVGPVILEFVESRRQGNGPVVLAAHNGRRFDVPFLLREFQDCSIEVPEWLVFLDTMPLARETKKKFGYKWQSLKLADIYQGYGLQTKERAHRAMADVHMLASVIGLVVRDLEMPAAAILERSFTTEDVLTSNKLFQNEADKDVAESGTEALVKKGALEVPWEEPVELDTLGEDSKEISETTEFDSFLDTSSVNVSQLNPALKQYVEIKKKMPNFVHLQKAGDFYEAFFEDAKALARACKTRVYAIDDGMMQVPVVRIPMAKMNVYLGLLLSKGLNVVKQNEFGAGEQKIAAVLTPGMLLIDGVLDESRNLYLAAVMTSSSSDVWGLAYCDLSTGDFFATQGDDKQTMVQTLLSLEPAELIMPLEESVIEFPCMTRPFSNFTALTNDSNLLLYAGNEMRKALQQCASADCAAGALLRYIQETQALTLDELPIRKLSLYSVDHYLSMDDSTRAYLQLAKGKRERSLIWAMDDTKTLMGSRMLKKWIMNPLLSIEGIVERQNAVEVLFRNEKLRSTLRSYLSDVMDIERLAANIARKQPVSREDLLAVSDSLLIIPKLCLVLEKLPKCPYFSAVLGTSTAVMDFAEEVQGVLNIECDGVEAGMNVIEATSKSTRTNSVDLFRAKAVDILGVFRETSEALAALDVLCSFAETAATRDYCRPGFVSGECELTIVSGRHPVLEIEDDFTPNSCYLGCGPSSSDWQRANMLILTGQTATGKSCYLQQIGLIQVLAQCGSFVPAKEARLAITDSIRTVGQGCQPAVEILKRITRNSLVLLDGFREKAGSHAVEAAVSRAVVEYLAKQVGARSIVCTGDHDLRFDDELPCIVNYHMSTLYRLTPGLATQEDAMKLVKADGYPEWVGSRATELLRSDETNRSSTNGSLKKVTSSLKKAGEGYSLWNRLMSFTKVKVNSMDTSDSPTATQVDDTEDSTPPRKVECETTNSREQDLSMLWQQVSAVLENTPATLALAKQKGSLLSISKNSRPVVVTIGSAPLFVRKFRQDEHAAALEAAFARILDQPVKLQVTEMS